jgi:Protein of unknown function (DUF565)
MVVQIFFILFGFSLGNLSPTSERLFFIFPEKITSLLHTSGLNALFLDSNNLVPKREKGCLDNLFPSLPFVLTPFSTSLLGFESSNTAYPIESRQLPNSLLKEGYFLVLFLELINFLVKKCQFRENQRGMVFFETHSTEQRIFKKSVSGNIGSLYSRFQFSKTLNSMKIGFLLGVFVDAFKVGS